MSRLPDQWHRYVWLAVSAAIAALSYWMFFSGAGAVHPDRRSSPVTHRDSRPVDSPSGLASSVINPARRK